MKLELERVREGVEMRALALCLSVVSFSHSLTHSRSSHLPAFPPPVSLLCQDAHVCEADDAVTLAMVDVLLRHGADACSLTQVERGGEKRGGEGEGKGIGG